MKKFLLALAMLSMTSLLFAGCGEAAPADEATPPVVVEPVVVEPVVVEPAVVETPAADATVPEVK